MGAAESPLIRSKAAGTKAAKGRVFVTFAPVAHTGVPREITKEVVPGKYYPNHEAVDFYGHDKEDIKLFAEMGFK